MSLLPRTIALAALLALAATPTGTAEGDSCVTMKIADYATGLRIIAEAGSRVAFGFFSGSPGDGVGYVLYIEPALCGGAGPPPLGQQDLQGVRETLPLPDPIPLP